MKSYALLALGLLTFACSGAESSPTGEDQTADGSGGNGGGGGTVAASGGSKDAGKTDGSMAAGGSKGSGGSTAAGGATGSGGSTAAGGTTGSGGSTAAGGATGSGGSTVKDAGPITWPPIPFDSGAVLTLDFTIDKSALPPLYYKNLTLLVDGLGAVNAQVVADGKVIASSPHGSDVMFTTSAGQIQVRLLNPTRPTDAGKFKKAVLQDDSAWAYSIGFDDNQNLKPAIDGITAMGWRGTLFMICSSVDPTRQEENWIIDEPGLIRERNAGWSLGNHSWGHTTVSGDVAGSKDSVRKCSTLLEGIAAKTNTPDYIVTAFAAPMFDSDWQSVILSMRDAKDTHVLFNETGGNPLVVDANGTATQWVETLFTFDVSVSRYTTIGWDSATAISDFDKEIATVTPTHHVWLNALAHGSNESSVLPTMQHIKDTYGPGSAKPVWVAPSDEIYGYLETARKATVTFAGTH